MKTKQITLFAICTALMLIIGYIFEAILPFGFMATYISPSPAEGLLIFLIMVSSLKGAYITLTTYILVLFTLKGLSPILINEIALILSANVTIILFYITYKKMKMPFIKSALITILSNTAIMTLSNAYFITPSFVKQVWTTYSSAFPGMSFGKVIQYVSTPLPAGGGILHGSLVKYGACFGLAKAAQKTYLIKK